LPLITSIIGHIQFRCLVLIVVNREISSISCNSCVWRQWTTLLCSSLALRPHCLTEVGLGALLSILPWRGAI